MCGGNWLRRGSTLELNGCFIVSKPRWLLASRVLKPCHTTFCHSCCWSAASMRGNNEFHLSASVSGSVFARAVSPPGCHTYLPHLKERSAVHIFSNTRVCFLLYSEERLERSGESPPLKIWSRVLGLHWEVTLTSGWLHFQLMETVFFLIPDTCGNF